MKYADDIRIFRHFEPNSSAQLANAAVFQSDMNSLTTWSKNWDLKFNLSKCCVLHFGRSNLKANYDIDDYIVENRNEEKDLGVHFSDKFNFNDHIDAIVNKANRKIGIMAHVFKNRNTQTLLPLYKTFVRPILQYNSVIWSPYTCLLYTSPSPRDLSTSRMPSSA